MMEKMRSDKIAARTFGIAFLIGYLSYGLGFGLLNALMGDAGSLAAIFVHKNLVILEAAIMMAVFAPVNIVLGAIMMPLFKTHNQALAYGYLGAAIASTVLLVVGAIFLLLCIPLSEALANAGPVDAKHFELLYTLFKKANFFAYQLAMVIWGLGGLIFAYLLYISKLVPAWLSKWGIFGYVVSISGAIFALFGIPIDLILNIPGGLFELFLSIRLIAKGFDVKGPIQ